MALSAVKNDNNSYDVGSFDAKTYFAELLRMIQGGATINITKNGKKVAVMESPKNKNASNAQLAYERILQRAQKINEQNGGAGISLSEIKEAVNYGRK